MMSRLSTMQSEFPDDLVTTESPSLGGRTTESEFSEPRVLIRRPSLRRRASRALARFMFAVCVGVAATLAWQSYGDAAKRMAASWVAQHGWSLPWLSYREADEPSPPTSSAAQAVPRTAPETVAPAVASPDQRRLAALKFNVATMRQKIEQLAAGQEQMLSDIAKLQAAEEEIRHQIPAPTQRPAAAPASKPMPTAPPARSSTPPR
jgi:hypothetical protein